MIPQTSGEEADFDEFCLYYDPGQEEAEGRDEVDEGGGGTAVVPRVTDQTGRSGRSGKS